MIDSMSQSVHAHGDYRIIRRNGAVVPFNPRKIATAMTKAFLAVASVPEKASSPVRPSKSDSAQNAGAVASTGVAGDAGGDGGGDGDGDDNGDGDGDGPRRPHSRPKNPHRFRAIRRRRNSSSRKSDPVQAHSRALTTFVLITALLLGTSLAFGLNGQRELAEKVLGTFVSVAAVAAALLRPK